MSPDRPPEGAKPPLGGEVQVARGAHVGAFHPVAIDGRAVFAGVPFTRLIGLTRSCSEDGRSRFVLEARRDLENMVGATHGGVIATLLDVAMASAAVSKLDFAMTAVTLNMTLSFAAPGLGRLTADGELLAIDDHVAQCRATVVDDAGRLVAFAQGSFRYLPHRPTTPPRQPEETSR